MFSFHACSHAPDSPLPSQPVCYHTSWSTGVSWVGRVVHINVNDMETIRPGVEEKW